MSVAVAPARSLRLSPLERIELLCDPGSVHAIRSEVGDGVVGAAGRVEGRPVFAYAQDSSFAGGSLGTAHADTILRVMQLAERAGAPVVGFVESAGARMQEGLAALGGFGRIFSANVALSGRVPQISVITGVSAGGGSYSPALTDFVVMVEGASMFLTGPGVVREAIGEEVDSDSLGGTRVHARNGVCDLVAADVAEAARATRELLSFLSRAPAAARPAPPGDPARFVPSVARRTYDVREVIRSLADAGHFLELAPRWARNMATGFARIEGRAVAVVANQPRYLGGVIDSAASEKAARFVRTCSSFGLPLVVLVDTPGFMPGVSQESAGVIRHGAGLLRAFSEARVPRLTVVLRKAYGGAYITMNSKDLGAHLAFAWPGAEIGVMAARQAVQIIHRREPSLDELAARYASEHLGAYVAARKGFIDEVIEPAETRERLAWGLATL